MKCLNCQADNIPINSQFCPQCRIHLPTLMRDILPNNTILRDETYQIKYPLGRGGFGVTYKAVHSILEQEVAIKEFYPKDFVIRNNDGTLVVLSREKEAFQKNLERFKREGKVLAKLNHPNIVRVTDLFEANGTAYLVMELLDGYSLRDELKSQAKGYFSPEWIKTNIEKLVDALDLVHQSGIYHLDIKPENTMLTKDGRIVLIDFGAAKQITGDKTYSTRIYTEAYAAPELINGNSIGVETDIFELGMMLYELLTGKRPPSAIQRLAEAQEHWQPRNVYPIWQNLIEKALILTKENRPKSIKYWWYQFYSSQVNKSLSSFANVERIVNDSDIKEIFLQLGHTNTITSIGISPDGKCFLSASCDKTIKLWDLASGKEINSFPFPNYIFWVNNMEISPNGKSFLFDSEDQTIKLCDLVSGKEIRSFSGHTSTISSIGISPDGKCFLSASEDQTIKLWDLASGKEIKSFFGHTDSVKSISFSPDGKIFLSASEDQTIKLWDLASGKEIKSFLGHTDSVNSISFSPDGKTFLSASKDQTIKLWDLASGKEIKSFLGHTDSIGIVVFSPNGKAFLSANSENADNTDNTIRLWDLNSSKEIRRFMQSNEPFNFISDVKFTTDGKFALSSGLSSIKLWDLASGKEIKSFSRHIGHVESLVFHSNSNFLFARQGNNLVLWDLVSGQKVNFPFEHNNFVNTLAISPDGTTFLLASSQDNIIRLYDFSGVVIESFFGHTGSVNSISFSPDGKFFLSASEDQTIKLWDLASGEKIEDYSSYSKYVNAIAFNPNGKMFAYALHEYIHIYEEPSEEIIRNFTKFWSKENYSHSESINSISFSPDGKFLLSASYDQTIKLWDLASGKEIKSFLGHTDAVNSISFSPNGKFFVSGGRDGIIKLWNLISVLETANPKELFQFIRFNDEEWVVLAPDGYYNASPKADRYISVRLNNNQIVDIDNYRSLYYYPDIIIARLKKLW